MFRRTLSQWLACCVALPASVLIGAAATMPAPGPEGQRLTANGGGVVQIAPCGRIVGVGLARAAPMPTDVHGQPQCGLTIISGATPDGSGTWLGEITDPRDGGAYQARLSANREGDLRLRVFIGIPALGATQVWHRFTEHLASACRIA